MFSNGRRWFRAALVAAGVLAAVVLLMVVFERSLIFFPTRYPDGLWDAERVAAGSGLVVEDCWYESADGVRLHSWWLRRENPDEGEPVLLFFHGNAGNLSHRADFALALARAVSGQVVLVGYRGYGRSDGRPSEAGLYDDARAAWELVTVERGVEAHRVVLFGKSLGGAVAIDLATRSSPAALIVESSFTSIPDMAATHYPFVPRALVRTRMDSLAKIPQIVCPKLFVHSKADSVVPFELGRALYEAASPPKDFIEVEGADHNETWLVGGEAYLGAIRDFVAGCVSNR